MTFGSCWHHAPTWRVKTTSWNVEFPHALQWIDSELIPIFLSSFGLVWWSCQGFDFCGYSTALVSFREPHRGFRKHQIRPQFPQMCSIHKTPYIHAAPLTPRYEGIVVPVCARNKPLKQAGTEKESCYVAEVTQHFVVNSNGDDFITVAPLVR